MVIYLLNITCDFLECENIIRTVMELPFVIREVKEELGESLKLFKNVNKAGIIKVKLAIL